MFLKSFFQTSDKFEIEEVEVSWLCSVNEFKIYCVNLLFYFYFFSVRTLNKCFSLIDIYLHFMFIMFMQNIFKNLIYKNFNLVWEA